MSDPERFRLGAGDGLLLVIDVQERLAAAMKHRDAVVRNIGHLLELARLTEIPVVLTEQYPKGLGPTVPELRDAAAPMEKIVFSCCGDAAFNDRIAAAGRRKIIVTGMETHVCVYQTALDLISAGYVPHVVSDAVCSRFTANWKSGLELLRQAGAVVTNTETVLFQVLGRAGTEEFRAISRRIR